MARALWFQGIAGWRDLILHSRLRLAPRGRQLLGSEVGRPDACQVLGNCVYSLRSLLSHKPPPCSEVLSDGPGPVVPSFLSYRIRVLRLYRRRLLLAK